VDPATKNKRLDICKKSKLNRSLIVGDEFCDKDNVRIDDHIKNLDSVAESASNRSVEYWTYYFQHVFPLSLQLFQAVAEYQLNDGDPELEKKYNEGHPLLPSLRTDFTENSYDVLITLVGFSLEPLLHTICTIKPKSKIYLICTENTRRLNGLIAIESFMEEFIKNGKLKLNDRSSEKLSMPGYQNPEIEIIPREVSAIFSESAIGSIKEILQDEHGQKVALDITGGKKSILAGAYALAAFYSLDTYYVDYEEFDTDKTRKPVPGTEFLNQVFNPLELYILREEKVLRELWRSQNYSACVELLEKMKNSLKKNQPHKELFDLGKKPQQIASLLQVASLYAAWDHFEYQKANGLKGDFTRYSEFHTTTDYDSLVLLARAKNKQTFNKIFQDKSNFSFVISWAADRINNGDRFLKRSQAKLSGDFNPSNNELACFRYFGAIEILAKRIIRDAGVESERKTLRPTLKAFKTFFENSTTPNEFNLKKYEDIFEFLELRDNLSHAFFDFDSAEKNIKKIRCFAFGLLKYFSKKNIPEIDVMAVLKSHQFAQLDEQKLKLFRPTADICVDELPI